MLLEGALSATMSDRLQSRTFHCGFFHPPACSLASHRITLHPPSHSSSHHIAGHRVTDAPTMAVARRVFESANDQLAAELVKGGLTAAPVKGGVFMAEVHDPQLGLVGQIKSVKLAAVEAALAAGRVPVLTSLGLSAAGESS